MDIYVVKPGDSLWSIGQKYGVDAEEIATVNKWKTPNRLIVGQALVIPTAVRRYVVKPGDSLYTIAHRFGTTVEAILTLNPLPAPYVLTIGQVLLIPAATKQFGVVETNGYIEPHGADRDIPIVRSVGPDLTYLSVFSYHVQPDASLVPINDEPAIKEATANKIAPMMVITNFEGGNFNPDTASAILTSKELQDKLFTNVLAIAQEKGYRAVNVDFERIYPQQRQLYNAFLTRMTQVMHDHGLLISTALAPKSFDIKTGAWHGAHDYAAHGRIVDFVVIMTYEWGWSGGPHCIISILDFLENKKSG
ncbi:LysM peptidoglycan-binding domain-containing protein [Aneurinibacillus uraniidurans]|uniref:LysM peptidoglycan-binding domain-containing protein n=1 Tax=Aneurinibacillus uraniidurans TaxID=2966586 RepID=UPI0023493686|nr:LysM peptidoglycan-binding domain-containing protein [Aneurinibacillus sp. B1]WCN39360.1 LysM peptidoglycan-binding domain-containing protein [Aneurinibacillus sp. B1]